jgi:hypothetical protein
MPRPFARFGLAALFAALASPLTAQVPLVPGALSLSAGVELPQGDGGILLEQGLTAGAAYRIGIPLMPFAVRAEAGVSRFGNTISRVNLGGVSVGAGTAVQVLHAGLAGEMTVLPLIVFRGYVVAGASYTRTTGDFSLGNAVDREARNGFGYSAGVGAEFRLPFLPAAGIEARLRVTPDALGGRGSLTTIPITARITF